MLVSDCFDGMPWLERVYQAGSLWDRSEMGAPADVHCYTRAEFARKREQLRVVREAAEQGLDVLAQPAQRAPASGIADRDHPLDRHPRALRDLGRDLDLEPPSRSASRSFGSVIIFM